MKCIHNNKKTTEAIIVARGVYGRRAALHCILQVFLHQNHMLSIYTHTVAHVHSFLQKLVLKDI